MTRKIDDYKLLELVNAGKKGVEIAAFFSVSPAAVSKKIKKLADKLPPSFENLTSKRKKFALAIASGKTQTQAALDSYECSSLDSAKSMGHKLMRQRDIQTAVAELMQEEGLTRRYRVQKLKTHIEHPDPNVSLKGLDQSWKLDGAYTDNHVHVHASFEDLKRGQAECRERVIRLNRKLKNDYMAEIKKMHPEMDSETVSEMAEKTLNTLLPERKKLDFLGSDIVEGEIVEN